MVGSLSGGNQQKVIVACEFARDTRLVIASQPTRGIDVGSIEYIHSRIVEERDGGAAVLIVSSELAEVMARSDRISTALTLARYKRLILLGKTALPLDEARRLVGPDCAYHLYFRHAGQDADGKPARAKRTRRAVRGRHK